MKKPSIAVPFSIKWLAALVVVGAVATTVYHYATVKMAGRLECLERDYTALKDANTLINTLHDEAREKEQAHAKALAELSAKYQEGLKNEKAAKERVIADLRSGALRLRIPVAHACSAAGGGDPDAIGTTAIGRDGEPRAELSVAASEFLVGLSSEADDVVYQLTACQAVVAADRKYQGEK